MLRAGDVLVERWVDRLGRNYADVTDAIREFIRRGVIVRTVINGLTFDGANGARCASAGRSATRYSSCSRCFASGYTSGWSGTARHRAPSST